MLKKLVLSVLVGAGLLLVSCGGEAEKKVVQEPKKELKIVSSTVAATQVMDKLDLDLVGIPTTKSTLPERYKDVKTIGQSFEPNFEVITSLTPDLLVIDSNFKDKFEEQSNKYGINTFYFDTTTFSNFKESIKKLGVETEKEEEANKLADELQISVDDVLKIKEKTGKTPSVAVLFGTSESFMLATDKSYVGDLLDTIGVKNITDDVENVDSAYLNFSMEQILKMNPDYILRLSHGDLETSKKAFDEAFSKDPAWKSLDATKNGKVVDLDPAIFGVSANLKVTEAIKKLGSIVYGE